MIVIAVDAEVKLVVVVDVVVEFGEIAIGTVRRKDIYIMFMSYIDRLYQQNALDMMIIELSDYSVVVQI